MNGEETNGGRGQWSNSLGGIGYGAGGAGWGYFGLRDGGNPHYAGGDNADCLVYVEW